MFICLKKGETISNLLKSSPEWLLIMTMILRQRVHGFTTSKSRQNRCSLEEFVLPVKSVLRLNPFLSS